MLSCHSLNLTIVVVLLFFFHVLVEKKVHPVVGIQSCELRIPEVQT